MSKGVFRYKLRKYENYCGRFPVGGSQKRKPNNEDKHGHGQEKRRPSTYVEEILFSYYSQNNCTFVLTLIVWKYMGVLKMRQWASTCVFWAFFVLYNCYSYCCPVSNSVYMDILITNCLTCLQCSVDFHKQSLHPHCRWVGHKFWSTVLQGFNLIQISTPSSKLMVNWYWTTRSLLTLIQFY